MKKTIFILLLILHLSLGINNCMCQWVQQTLPLSGRSYNLIFFDNNTGVLSSESPALFRTTNSGNNWISQPERRIFYSMQKIDSVCLYSIGGGNGSSKIYRTFDKGQTWDSVSLSGVNSYATMSFINRDTGWISGFDGSQNLIWKTTNGGITIFPLTYSIGWGNIYMYRVSVNGNYIGWHSNGVGTMKTTDGGVNWFIVSSSIGIGCTYFLNKDTGWTTCASSMYKTFDGGYNWTLQQLPSGDYILDRIIKAFFVVNKNIIYGVGGNRYFPNHRVFGIIWKTTNGGLNWGYQQPDTITVKIGGYRSIFFIDSLTGWIGNDDYGNKVAYTNIGGGPIIYTKINNNFQTLTKNFELYQNYPNPFNQCTIINVQCTIKSYLKIKIFDISGREITTLMNEKKSPGKYEVRFNGENLSSGIYFYSLYADGERVGTKRMVLIK